MASQLVTIADAIAAELKEQSAASAFAATFSIRGRDGADDRATFRPWERLEDIDSAGIILRVIPWNQTPESESRRLNKVTHEIHLAFQAKATGSVSEDTLAELGEQVTDYLSQQKRPAAATFAVIQDASFSPIVDAEGLRTTGTLTMVATLNYMAWRNG